jgi:hypothetical protein
LKERKIAIMGVQWSDIDPKVLQEIIERLGKAAREEIERRYGGASAGEAAERFVTEMLQTLTRFDLAAQPGRCPPYAAAPRPSTEGEVQDLGPSIMGTQAVGLERQAPEVGAELGRCPPYATAPRKDFDVESQPGRCPPLGPRKVNPEENNTDLDEKKTGGES